MIPWLSSGVLLVCALPAFSQAAEGPDRTSLLEERFHQLDRNGDGKLSREEAAGAPWFERLDRRGTGVITLEQIRAVAQRLGNERLNRAADKLGTKPGEPPASSEPVAPPTSRTPFAAPGP